VISNKYPVSGNDISSNKHNRYHHHISQMQENGINARDRYKCKKIVPILDIGKTTEK